MFYGRENWQLLPLHSSSYAALQLRHRSLVIVTIQYVTAVASRLWQGSHPDEDSFALALEIVSFPLACCNR